MFIINTTFAAEKTLASEVKLWCSATYADAAEAFGFTDVSVCRIISFDETVDAESFAVRMQCADTRLIDQWFNSTGNSLLNECQNKWNGRVLPFTTYM
ncbi:MAG: DUF4286 family protein, partial [Muribaculaceae bacterium]|nr:DUF4286 family protein [Muribaculaceae bacterium]